MPKFTKDEETGRESKTGWKRSRCLSIYRGDLVKKRSITVQEGEVREERCKFKRNEHVFGLRSVNGKVVSRNPQSNRVNIRLIERYQREYYKGEKKTVSFIYTYLLCR